MKIIRYILLPVVPIYFLVTWFRNKMYDWDIFKSAEYKVPTICVGNLSVGGTGKTPMIEYLVRLLNPHYKIATLSRGYKRSSKGFIIADRTSTFTTIGDEPFQFYKKFEDVIVSVDADRRNGISKLMLLETKPEVVLLDDAFQHRRVKSKFNVLLTAYNDLYINDIPLPTGNLREPKCGAKRADLIVITKCPDLISDTDKRRIIQLIQPESYQTVFFSWIAYSDVIKNQSGEKKLNYLIGKEVSVVTGIANPKPLVEFLENKHLNFEHLNFDDHHEFTASEIQNLKTKQFILTTEKDFMRLSAHFEGRENLYYLPIELRIDKSNQFDEILKNIIK